LIFPRRQSPTCDEGRPSVWRRKFRDLIRLADRHIHCRAIYDIESATAWHSGRIAIVGDAAIRGAPHVEAPASSKAADQRRTGIDAGGGARRRTRRAAAQRNGRRRNSRSVDRIISASPRARRLLQPHS